MVIEYILPNYPHRLWYVSAWEVAGDRSRAKVFTKPEADEMLSRPIFQGAGRRAMPATEE